MSPLMRVREAAKKEKSLQFTSLMHHLTPELLKGSFYQLKRGVAKGIDGISWKAFQENLDKEIQRLHEALQCGSYKPLPSLKDERLITLIIKWIRVGSINDEGRREIAK